MAGNIKGITIEFRGDTTKLDEALRQINNETRKIDKELKNVDKALKFNPTNVELWRQKQQLLNQKISETKEKLTLLKNEQARMDAAGVDKTSEEYRKLQREIIETESKCKTFEGQLRKIGNVNLKAASEQFKQWGTQLESAGRAMQGISMAAGALAASIGAIAVKSGKWADDLNTMSKVYSIGTGDLQKYAAAAELVDVDVETIAKSHTKLEKSMASAAEGTGENAEAFQKLGVSVTDANGNLRDGDQVWQETIQALGNVENETERDALAMQLLGKSAMELNPLIEDGGEAYKNLAETMEEYGLDFIDQETLDKANEFNDELDTIKAIGLVTFQSLGATLAGYLAPALQKVVKFVGRVANWLSKLSPQTLTIIGIIAGLVAAIGPLLIVFGKLAMAISSLMNLANLLGVGIGALAGPIGIAIAAIVAIIAIGVLLYKNWDTIKAKALQLWNSIKTTFNGIKTAIVTAWNNARTAVSNAVNSIRSKVVSTFSALRGTVSSIWSSIKSAITSPISNAVSIVSGYISRLRSLFPISIGKIFSNLKLPHFKISGGKAPFGIGGLGTKPSISVDWYAKGSIFRSPQIIGVGESGPEAVVPLDKFWEKMDAIAEGTGQVNNFYITGDSPKQIAEEVRRILIQEAKRERMAWQ